MFALRRVLLFGFILFVLGINSECRAAVLFSDNFDSYGTTAAMNATWANGGTATLSTGFGNLGNSLRHPGSAASFSGGNTNTVTIPTATSAGGILRFSADIYDDGSIPPGSILNDKRITAGLRSGTSNILELGMYNDPSHYAFRAQNFASGNVNWVAFSGIVNDSGIPIGNSPITGWHRFQVDFGPTTATFSLDLNSDGIINATTTIPLTVAPAGFTQIRLGGPSDVQSNNGGANFDNIRLEILPETSTLTLMLFAACFYCVGVTRTRCAGRHQYQVRR